MTEGERMIWAAAYAGYLGKHLEGVNPPDHVIADRAKWIEWERKQVCRAAEWAWACVGNLRDGRERIAQKYAPSIAAMVDCMLEITS